MANVRLILGPGTHVGKGLNLMHEIRAWLIERAALMLIDAQIPTNIQVWRLTQAIERAKEDSPTLVAKLSQMPSYRPFRTASKGEQHDLLGHDTLVSLPICPDPEGGTGQMK